jgi:hypothetical protein
MRQTFEEVLRVPAINRYFADEVSGFGVAYPEPLFAPDGNWEHRDGVSGQRLPGRELVLQDGSRPRSIACLRMAAGSACNSPRTKPSFPMP